MQLSDAPNTIDDDGSVHIWRIQIPKTLDLGQTAPLSTAEQARLAKMANASMRRLFLHVHRAKREILARYLNVSAKELALRETEFGKPMLDSSMPAALEFNISHTANMAVMAVSQIPVGVDLESAERRVNVLALARRYFDSATLNHIADLDETHQSKLFLRYWTQLEAYKKATGLGLRGGDQSLKMATASTPNLFEPFADPNLADHWLVAELDVIPDHALSVVIPHRPGYSASLQVFEYQPD